jgi:hypothetical protein
MRGELAMSGGDRYPRARRGWRRLTQPLSRRRDARLHRSLSQAEAELLYLREENTRLRLERACEPAPPVDAEPPVDGGGGLDSTLAAEVLVVRESLLEVCERLDTALRSARDLLRGPALVESGGDEVVPYPPARVAKATGRGWRSAPSGWEPDPAAVDPASNGSRAPM